MWHSSWYALDSLMISGFFGFSRRSFWINSHSSRLLLRWSTQMSQTQHSFPPCFFFPFLWMAPPFIQLPKFTTLSYCHSPYPSEPHFSISETYFLSIFTTPTHQVQNHFIFFCSFLYLLSTCITEKSRKYKWDIDDSDMCYYVLCCFKGFARLSSLQPL